MTIYWCYFSLIIANNSLTVYCILAKCGTKMCLYTPLLCAKFQGNQIMRLHFMAIFVSAKRGRKKRKKKKLSQFLKSHISGTLEAICLTLKCGVLKLVGMFTAKIILFHQGSTELWRCDNCVFFLPVNILTGVACWLLGPYRVS